jgi:leucine dehydrogenase
MSALAMKAISWDRDCEEVRAGRGKRSGLMMAVAVHRTVAGKSLGGCRIWSYRSVDDVVREAERLARSMTLKAAIAGLPLGGAKAVISTLPGEGLSGEQRDAALRDFAELVDAFDGRYMTAQDVGTSLRDVEFLSRLTPHVAGHPVAEGGSGDPSKYTARGVAVGIDASVCGPLSRRHVVVVGLGHVGSELTRRLRAVGARVTATDLDGRKRTIAHDLGASWVAPEKVFEIQADVLAPCALGGIIDHQTVAELQVPVVAGAANNQLAGDEIADLLRDRGIVWAPDFVINAGGLIAVADELNGFDHLRVAKAIKGISHTLSEIYTDASRNGTNTLVAARSLAAERLGGTHGDDN